VSGTRGAVDGSKLFVASVMVLLLFALTSWLQGRFDASDHEKAEKLVATYRAGGKSIRELLLEAHPGVREDQIEWQTEIRQSCLGHVRVTASLPGAAPYAFDVNLSGPSLHPTDPRTLAIMKALTATTAR